MVRNLEELGLNLQKIVARLTANQDLLKLLYYTDKDPLSGADLSTTQISQDIFEKLIKIIPRVGPKETAHSIVSLRVVNGRTSGNNEITNITIGIEVFVPLTQWVIKNQNLRPFAIMGQIQQSLNNKIVNGFGKLQFDDFALNFLTEEMSCYEMTFTFEEYE